MCIFASPKQVVHWLCHDAVSMAQNHNINRPSLGLSIIRDNNIIIMKKVK